MVCKRKRRCYTEDCDLPPSRGYHYCDSISCIKHSKPGMSEIKHKFCITLNCKNNAFYGLAPFKPEWCDDHRPLGGINAIFDVCKKCRIIIMRKNLTNGICRSCESSCSDINFDSDGTHPSKPIKIDCNDDEKNYAQFFVSDDASRELREQLNIPIPTIDYDIYCESNDDILFSEAFELDTQI